MVLIGNVNAFVIEQYLMENLSGDLFSQRIIRDEDPKVLEMIAGKDETRLENEVSARRS